MASAKSEVDTLLDPLPSFEIGIHETGEPDSTFNFDRTNDPLAPWQRQELMQRKSVFNIQCQHVDIVHGRLGGDPSSSPATLIVLKFWFDQRHRKRRILSADIRLEFSGMDAEGTRPEVYKIAPCDRTALEESTAKFENSDETSLIAGASGGGATAQGGHIHKKVVSEERSFATTVSGSIDLEGFSYGSANCASWSLLENERREAGIPSHLQVAVLLRREDDEPFTCTLDVKSRFDAISTVYSWAVGGRDHEDPVLYHPKLSATNQLRIYDNQSLGSLDLDSLWGAGLIGSHKSRVIAPVRRKDAPELARSSALPPKRGRAD